MVMASAGVNMTGGDGVGNPTAASASTPECRMRRRRRLDPSGSGADAEGPSWVRRLRPAPPSQFPSSSSPPPPPSQGSADRDDDENDDDDDDDDEQQEADPEMQNMELPPPLPPASPAVAAQVWPVAFGSLSMAGRMRMMEDTVSLHPDLCTWVVDGSPMHFFAVFDGHGGSHVSALCRDRMHLVLAEELTKEGAAFLQRRQQQQQSASGAGTSSAAGAAGSDVACWSEQAEEERAWRSALQRSFRRVDALAALACACGRVSRTRCPCPLSGTSSGIVGSTAVVAVLVRGRLVVANCGDSRAVLCRGPAGTPPVPLSSDHKPNRPDEQARIEAVGGRVVFNNGPRVRGILAMSRALGDRMLRPEVIAEPEITITERTAEDQCLILASDGMWDVISNDVACNVARHCLEDGNPPPIDPPAAAAATAVAAPAMVGRHEAEPRCLRAASLLARLAIGRETLDNISIIVIDLKHRE